MHSGSLRVRGDAGTILGLLMSGGKIMVKGRAGKRAGWRMKGGTIKASGFGPEAADGCPGTGLMSGRSPARTGTGRFFPCPVWA